MKQKVISYFIMATMLVASLSGCGTSKSTDNSATASATVSTTATDATTSDTSNPASDGGILLATSPSQLPTDSQMPIGYIKAESFDAKGVSSAGQLPITKEKTVITCFADVDPESDVNNNAFLKYLEAQTNIQLKITQRPSSSSDSATAKNLLFASGDYPELFLCANDTYFTMDEMLKYGSEDKTLIPLNDLIDKYAFGYKQVFNETPGFKKIMVAPDNNIYGLNNGQQGGHSGAYPKMWVNTDWMKKLGLSDPQTTDDFYNMLKAFKEKDPGGVGSKKIISLSGDVDNPIDCWIVNSFLPYSAKTGAWLDGSNSCYVDDNGKIIFAADKSEFKEALTYMHKLYSEGLVDIAAYSQTDDQLKQTVMKKPFGVGAFTAMHVAEAIDLSDKDAYSAYHSIAPVAGPNGVRYQSNVQGINYVNSNTRASFAITDKCENPEAAFRVMDFFMNPDVAIRKAKGVEGIDWKPAPEGQKNIRGGNWLYQLVSSPKNTGTSASDPLKLLSNRYFYVGPVLDSLSYRDTYSPDQPDSVLNSDPNFYEARLEKETIPLAKYYYPRDLPNQLFMTADDTATFTELRTNINIAVSKAVAQFVIGDKSIDKDWDSYVKDLNKFGLQEFLDLYQRAYDSYNAPK